MLLKTKRFYVFENFRLDPSERLLLRDGTPVPITPKVFETLQLLLENAGRLLEKDELMKRLWQDRFVEEVNLSFNIKMLRKALGDDANNPRFIETVRGRGFRFIAKVEEVSETGESKPEDFAAANAESAAPPATKFKSRLAFALIFSVLALSAIVFGAWFIKREPSAAILSAPFASEKLTTGGRVFHAVISPDGKMVIYTNETGGKSSVWLRQIDSGNNVEIIPASDDLYFGLALSPNGDFLYFARNAKNAVGQADIYRTSIFGGAPQKIVTGAQGWMAISPDGANLSFVRCDYRQDENCSLWTADAADGKNEKKMVVRAPPFRIGDNEFSPDGKRIVFAVGQSENQADQFALTEVEIESGRERELTNEKFFDIKAISRLPEGGWLITAKKAAENNYRIRRVAADGSVSMPLTKDSENYSGLNLDKQANALIATQVKADFRLSVIQTDNPAGKKVLGSSSAAAFAPDGTIVFSSPMSGNEEIWSIKPDGSGQRQLTNNEAEEVAPVVSSNGKFIFYSSNQTGAQQVWRMNPDGGDKRQITQTVGGASIFVSPDNLWIYYRSALGATLWRASTAGGGEQQILNERHTFYAFPPDGASLAFFARRGDERIIKVISLEDKREIKTFAVTNGFLPINLVWLPDGKSLVYILADAEYRNNVLRLQPLEKAESQKIADLGDDQIKSLAAAPDGKTFAVVQGNWQHDAVLLRGLK